MEITVEKSIPKVQHITFLVWLSDQDCVEYNAELEPDEMVDDALKFIKEKQPNWKAIEVSVFFVRNKML